MATRRPPAPEGRLGGVIEMAQVGSDGLDGEGGPAERRESGSLDFQCL